ncbi:ABC transporter ATP-binding protein [Brunnivagina elsteri]|uniref:ABC transporter n=1 Tax=Brunnivagina elsteri CCALA 953 TaxID=987040 RepID=A0A2A2TJQ3_9CYAN|nr:ABC transporter ATP-binding protein [Calothrix elsteri]PAX55910.1 ABC transporter [Calothrix elsteri CCALA 953]
MTNQQTPTLQRFGKYLIPHRKTIPVALGFVIFTAIMQGLAPFLIGWSIDNLIAKGNLPGLMQMLLLILAVYLAGFTSIRAQILRINWITQNVLAQLRQDIFTKLQTLPLSFFDTSSAGDLMSRLLNDVSTVNQVFGLAIAQIVGSVFSLVGIAIAMLVVNLQLGLLSNIVIPLVVIITTVFGKLARSKFRVTRQSISELSTRIEEDLGSIREAQLFNRSELNISNFEKLNAANRDANIQAVTITAAFLPTIDVLNTLSVATIFTYGSYLVITQTMTVGTVTAFLIYLQQFFQPLQILSQFYTQAQSALAGLERIFLLLDEPSQLKDANDAIEMPLIDGKVDFENVTFGYKQNQTILKNVNIHAKSGEMIALVGATGAGKSTIINLILRFYDVTKGAIKIDGIDVRQVTQASLRRQIGIVLQDMVLFSGTIAENIAFGNPEATLAEIEAAAKVANVHEFIMTLPQAYDTAVGTRGVSLSQGQRQLISIARAVLINPRIMILDEATSSIDTRTEALIQDAMSKLLKNKTSFVIAHRLSTVTQADKLLVVQQGEILEQGTHAELIAQNGVYANLYSLQFGVDTAVVNN